MIGRLYGATVLWCAFLIVCCISVEGRAGLLSFNIRIVGDLVGLAAVVSLMLLYWRKEQHPSVTAERVRDFQAVQLIETIEGDLRTETDGPA